MDKKKAPCRGCGVSAKNAIPCWFCESELHFVDATCGPDGCKREGHCLPQPGPLVPMDGPLKCRLCNEWVPEEYLRCESSDEEAETGDNNYGDSEDRENDSSDYESLFDECKQPCRENPWMLHLTAYALLHTELPYKDVLKGASDSHPLTMERKRRRANSPWLSHVDR